VKSVKFRFVAVWTRWETFMGTRIDIKSGPELDKAVADAIGLECHISDTFVMPICFLGKSHEGSPDWPAWDKGSPFQPSRDLNAAFSAADKVGLFDGCSHILGKGSVWSEDSHGHWWINHTRDGSVPLSLESEVSSGHSLALAICAAILKAKT